MSQASHGRSISSRHSLSKRDRRNFAEKVAKELGAKFREAVEGSRSVEVAKVLDNGIQAAYYLDGVLAVLEHSQYGLLPSLFYIYRTGVTPELASVYVDSGAVARILNGADVMAPGITRVEGEVRPGDKVLVKDEKGRPIAVGVSLVSSSDVGPSKRGKAVLNLHHVGDDYWKLAQG
jgi:PUA domain protein